MMFSKGWHITQTRSIVDSAAALNCSSSSAVMSPTLLATTAGSTFTGGLAWTCGADAPEAMAVVRTANAEVMTNECSFTKNPLEIYVSVSPSTIGRYGCG